MFAKISVYYEIIVCICVKYYIALEPYWSGVSKEAKKLVTRMLKVDPERRISIDQILSNPWITTHAPTK